ncbi:MAG: EpsG family protein [Alistipes sp.]|nr:EpsG family protein [Alistipes sp.]
MSLVFFILAPFLTFIASCTNLERRANQIVFVLFFALFGYCHTFEDTRADSYRKYIKFNNYTTQDVGSIIGDFTDGDTKDIFEELLFSVTKSLTDNPHILMMLVGLFGGFFYMLVVKRFLEDKKTRYTVPIAILLGFMIIESNIPLMGGIRNFCAFPLFMYSMIRVLIDGKRIWLIGLLLTPLIHFGYIIAVAAALLIWLINIPTKLLHYLAVIACVASLFMTTSSYISAIDVFADVMDNEAIVDRVSNYGDEATEEHFNESLTTRLIKINNQISACFIALLLIYIRRNRERFITTEYLTKMYRYLLFFIALSFATISFSVVGQRYVYIAMILLYFMLLNIYQNNSESRIATFIKAMPVVYILHILWTAYNCYCNTGFDIYWMPMPFLML